VKFYVTSVLIGLLVVPFWVDLLVVPFWVDLSNATAT